MTAHPSQRRTMREAMAQLSARKHVNRARARRIRDDGAQPPTTCRSCGSTYQRGGECWQQCPPPNSRRIKDIAEIF